MGVIVKYQLTFPGIGLAVSNDLYAGEFTIDADITAELLRGPLGGSFDIKMYDLPEGKLKQLDAQVKNAKLARVVIKLGYFDGPFETVMEGVYRKLRGTVEDGRLVTSLGGLEIATHALTATRLSRSWLGQTSLSRVVAEALGGAAITEGEVDRTADLQSGVGDKQLQDIRFPDTSLMALLEQLARRAGAELLVSDKRVHIGKPIKDDRTDPLGLLEGVNLAIFEPFKTQLTSKENENLLEPLPPAEATGFSFTITGEPRLRPAQRLNAAMQDYESAAGSEFRVHSVVHRLSATGGYTCKGVALRDCVSTSCRQQEQSAGPPSAETILRSLTTRLRSDMRRSAAVDVGRVQEYKPGSSSDPAKHRATLYEGQRFPPTETQPSIRAAVESDDASLAPNKPIVSPFAWHKCGLVVPVYPGMKALLGHNLALQDDALVVGFLWSEEPTITPPSNNAGDWWLCLPVDLDGSSPPVDGTKAANDLTAANGKRVIEAKGLKITVGADRLRTVGTRPAEGADDELLIEHKSGTLLKIAADGALTIEASTLTIKGNVTIEGNVDIR